MKNILVSSLSIIFTMFSLPGVAFAEVLDAKSQLGQELTPLGAEKSGNSEGTIPEWAGGLPRSTDGVNQDRGYRNPFKSDEPLFVIDASNYKEYKSNLTTGQIEMLKRYPETWKLKVFPTRRSASYPEKVYSAAKKNADDAELLNSGNTVSNVSLAYPFPVPDNGMEVMWNHIMRYRGDSVERNVSNIRVNADGDYSINSAKVMYLFNDLFGDNQGDDGNVLFYSSFQTTAPARKAGEMVLVHDTIDPINEARQSWIYFPGQRRVRRAPTVGYDTPTGQGMMTVDDVDMFNGALDRYKWELVSKKEIFVPYNNYDFASKDISYSDIVMPNHVNPELLRYELHRVWHVRAKLKAGRSHIYSQREFYVDEDTFQVLIAESYDSRGKLWRVGEAYTINYYDQPLVWDVGMAFYDLNSGGYFLENLANEEQLIDFSIEVSPRDFSPGRLRQRGVR